MMFIEPLDFLRNEFDFLQAEVFKNSHLPGTRNDNILYFDCTNYFFEIEQEDDIKKLGKSKENRPNPIIQMGLFIDRDDISLYQRLIVILSQIYMLSKTIRDK